MRRSQKQSGRPGDHDGRFAPSPTGELHLGNLRTAILAWLFARSAGARFILRVEDLDEGRVRERHVNRQLDDLRAIGIEWDGEPVRQSQRIPLYREALEQLRSQGLVYPCFCSRREIRDAASAPHGERPEVYPGTCRELSEREAGARVARGDGFALRLRAGKRELEVEDRMLGRTRGVADDIVLLRRDGAFAYNLAVVVDDALQEIGEVVRGDDLWPSTIDQAHLCDLLDLRRPSWAHVPLVLGADGKGLAKRHGSVSLSELAEHGVGADRVRAFLLGTIGVPGADGMAATEQLIASFDPARLPREPIRIDDPVAELSPAVDRTSSAGGAR